MENNHSRGDSIITEKINEFLSKNKEKILKLDNKCDEYKKRNKKPINIKDISYPKDKIDILILTATETETDVLHMMMGDTLETVIINSHVYHLGKLGLYYIVHAESDPGSTTLSGANTTARIAIEKWNPKMVISLGIAYGGNIEKQNLCDVIFATLSLTYGGGKIENNKIHLSSTAGMFSSDPFINRLIKHISRYDYDFKIYRGAIASGDFVIDSKIFKEMIFKAVGAFNPVGGEMESHGIYSAVQEANTGGANVRYCFVLKGICDWGEEKNSSISSENKDSIQRFAAKNALSILMELLENEEYLKSSGVLTIKDYNSITKLKEQLHQHPNLISAISEVKQVYKKCKELYNHEEYRIFLDHLKEYGYCDDNYNLTEKGILFLFEVLEFDPKTLYRDKK